MALSFSMLSPASTIRHCESDATIAEAIETCFGWDDDITMIWNGVSFPLSWKCVISDIWRDILLMLRWIKTRKTFSIQWPCKSFFVYWSFIIGPDTVTIHADWGTVPGQPHPRDSLNQVSPVVECDKEEFVQSWHSILA
jgi:hypothetical protein